MQGIPEISQGQPTVISSEELKALLYLTIRGQNGLAPRQEAPQTVGSSGDQPDQTIDAEKGVDIKA